MKINMIENQPQFTAKIRINKPKIYNALLESGGEDSVSGGISTISTGASLGADMTVHNLESSVPIMQGISSLFNQFAEFGHKILKAFLKEGYEHNGYDASFFGTSMSGSGSLTYSQGMNNIIKAFDNKHKSKIPT